MTDTRSPRTRPALPATVPHLLPFARALFQELRTSSEGPYDTCALRDRVRPPYAGASFPRALEELEAAGLVILGAPYAPGRLPSSVTLRGALRFRRGAL